MNTHRLVILSTRLVWLIALTLAALIASSVRAQTVTFVFIAPDDTIQKFGGSTIREDLPPGYGGVSITAANIRQFAELAPQNMRATYDALQPGTILRSRVDEVLQINGGKTDVQIFLTDDRTGLTGKSRFFVTRVIDDKVAVWPAARVAASANNRWAGKICVGELTAHDFVDHYGGMMKWQGVILHETLHTQFVGKKTKWGSISIVYGGDGTHYIYELLGEQQNPFEEGLGNFFDMTHNDPAGLRDLTAFFSRTDQRYFIESRSVLAGTAEVWNAPHTEHEHPLSELENEADRTGRYLWRHYAWNDVPGFFLLFTESTSMAFHGYFWKYVNRSRPEALKMNIESSKSMSQDLRKRFLTYAVNRLALQMEAFANTEAGKRARADGRLTSSMFPFALLDVLTHFGMSEKEYKDDYNRNYPDQQPLAFAQYWDHRAAVKNLVWSQLTASPIQIEEAIDLVNRYFQNPSRILVSPGTAPAADVRAAAGL